MSTKQYVFYTIPKKKRCQERKSASLPIRIIPNTVTCNGCRRTYAADYQTRPHVTRLRPQVFLFRFQQQQCLQLLPHSQRFPSRGRRWSRLFLYIYCWLHPKHRSLSTLCHQLNTQQSSHSIETWGASRRDKYCVVEFQRTVCPRAGLKD